jgi:7-cyano-7-deazaguanine synthase
MQEMKQFVLLSGGLDSSTVLAQAIDYQNNRPELGSWRRVRGVAIDYGQRHKKEIEAAMAVTDDMRCEFGLIKLPRELLAGSPLTDASQPIPDVSYAELPHGISPTYVPFRNGLFISILAAHAQAWVGQKNNRSALIHIGAHSEDAENDAYPDCSGAFINAMREAVFVGTYGKVKLIAPFVGNTKAEIVQAGFDLGVPFDLTWSCYKGEELHCGTCPTCRARKEAFKKAGVVDPTKYAA